MTSEKLGASQLSEVSAKRMAIVKEAKSWISTPYVHMGRVKGAGTDCLMFIVEVYQRVGIVGDVTIPFYRPDFMHHQSIETYLNGLLEHGHEVKYPLPGDVAIFKWGRIFAHAGIVLDWPWMLHAQPAVGVVRMNGTTGRLTGREHKFISAFDDGEPV